MSQVELTTLRESCEFFNGKAHEKSIDENGKYIVVNSKFISQEGRVVKRTKEQMFPLYKGDIVMVMSDVPNGKALAKCFIIDQDDTYSLNQRICCIRSKEFDTKYLYYQLNRNEHFLAFNNGENQTNLRKDDILDCPLIKPPKETQKELVLKIDDAYKKLNVAIENIEANIQNSKDLFFSLLEDKYNGLPKSKIANECKVIAGQSPEGKHYNSEGIGLPFYQGKKEFKNKYLGEPTTWTSFVTKEAESGDILMSVRAPVGPVNISTEKICIGRGLAAIRTNKTINNDFLYYYLLKQEKRINGNVGAVFNSINKKQIEEIVIPITSITRQIEIVKEIESIERETERLTILYEKKLQSLEQFKKAILIQAFERELIETE
jgi:type I restriction enzyme S subunit